MLVVFLSSRRMPAYSVVDLAGAGRPGDQNDPVRLMNQFVESRERAFGHAEVGQLELRQIFLE